MQEGRKNFVWREEANVREDNAELGTKKETALRSIG